MNEKLTAKMDAIRKLLARADHPNTPAPEADSCRLKAEQMMVKYRIEETELAASGALDSEAFKPIKYRMEVSPSGSPFYNTYYNLAVYAANHAGVRTKYDWGYNEDGLHTLYLILVGYESDIRYVEALFMSARIVFADRMEPKRDPNMSDEDNVYRMRNAGLERGRIGQLMGWGGEKTPGPAKVTRVYRKACKQRGEAIVVAGRDFNVKTFREEYANGFCSEFWNALWKAKHAAGEVGTLVLAGREDNVNDAFYEFFPDLKPKASLGVDTVQKKSKRQYKMTKADLARLERKNTLAGQAGSAAGRQAARDINVGGPKVPGKLT